jgi:trimeric autotransporter adhesin
MSSADVVVELLSRLDWMAHVSDMSYAIALLLQIWRARYGPCVRTLPAPPDAHLRTVHSSAAGGLARCFMLSSDDNNNSSSSSSSSSGGDDAQRSHCIRAQQLVVTEADLLCLPKVQCREVSADDGRDKLQRVTVALRALATGETAATAAAQANTAVTTVRAVSDADAALLLQRLEAITEPLLLSTALAALDAACSERSSNSSTSVSAAAAQSGKQQVQLQFSAAFYTRTAELADAAAARAAAVQQPQQQSQYSDPAAALRLRSAVHSLYSVLAQAEADSSTTAAATSSAIADSTAAGGSVGASAGAFVLSDSKGWALAQLAEEFLGWIAMSTDSSTADTTAAGASTTAVHEHAAALSPLPDFPAFYSVAAAALEPAAVEGCLQWRSAVNRSSATAGASDDHIILVRAQTRVVDWLMRPLLTGTFGMHALDAALSKITVPSSRGSENSDDAAAQQQQPLLAGFAAWFLALPPAVAAHITVQQEARACPLLRWLRSLIVATATRSGDATAAAAAAAAAGADAAAATAELYRDGEAAVVQALQPVFAAVRSSSQLESAMLLAVVLGEAEASAAVQLEARTLGAVVLRRAGRWAALARKQRACLLVDHRRHKKKVQRTADSTDDDR